MEAFGGPWEAWGLKKLTGWVGMCGGLAECAGSLVSDENSTEFDRLI